MYWQDLYISRYMAYQHSLCIGILICSEIFPFRYFYRQRSTTSYSGLGGAVMNRLCPNRLVEVTGVWLTCRAAAETV